MDDIIWDVATPLWGVLGGAESNGTLENKCSMLGT